MCVLKVKFVALLEKSFKIIFPMKHILFLFSILTAFTAFPQVGINTTNPHSSSMLDITASDKGLLIPRVGLTSVNDLTTIPNPETSLLVYKIGPSFGMPNGFYYFDGTQWSPLGGSGGGGGSADAWNITGNNNTNANHFMGTRHYAEVNFRAGNTGLGTLHPRSSVAWGRDATATGSNAIALGYQSTASQTESTALGPDSRASGSSSMALGASSRAAQTEAVAVGVQSVVTGNKGTAVGYGSNASQTEAMAVGSFSTASGSKSTALGHSSRAAQTETLAAGFNAKATGSHSLAVGHSSEASANMAMAIGDGAEANANEAMALGNGSYSASNKSIALGSGSLARANEAVAIGTNAMANVQNTIILGKVDSGPSVGVGTNTPAARLDVDDTFKLGQNGNAHKGLSSFVHNYVSLTVNANSTGIANISIPSAIRPSSTQATVMVTLDNGVNDDISIVWAKLGNTNTIRIKVRNEGNSSWYGGKMYFTVIEF